MHRRRHWRAGHTSRGCFANKLVWDFLCEAIRRSFRNNSIRRRGRGRRQGRFATVVDAVRNRRWGEQRVRNRRESGNTVSRGCGTVGGSRGCGTVGEPSVSRGCGTVGGSSPCKFSLTEHEVHYRQNVQSAWETHSNCSRGTNQQCSAMM